jgi:hypothetical protein
MDDSAPLYRLPERWQALGWRRHYIGEATQVGENTGTCNPGK